MEWQTTKKKERKNTLEAVRVRGLISLKKNGSLKIIFIHSKGLKCFTCSKEMRYYVTYDERMWN